jgi:hypothetical protein
MRRNVTLGHMIWHRIEGVVNALCRICFRNQTRAWPADEPIVVHDNTSVCVLHGRDNCALAQIDFGGTWMHTEPS